MLDGIGEGISIIDEDLKIVWVNPIIEKWADPLDGLLGKARSCGYCWQANNQPANQSEISLLADFIKFTQGTAELQALGFLFIEDGPSYKKIKAKKSPLSR